LSETPLVSTDHRGFTSFTDISPCKHHAHHLHGVRKFDLQPAYADFMQATKQEEVEAVKKEMSDAMSSEKSEEELILKVAQTPQEDEVKIKQEAPAEEVESSSFKEPSNESSSDSNYMSHGKKPAPKVKKVIRKPKSQLQPQFKPPGRKSQNKPAVAQNPEQFICKSCHEEFGTGQALGGHMSRVHPGESTSYQKKL